MKQLELGVSVLVAADSLRTCADFTLDTGLDLRVIPLLGFTPEAVTRHTACRTGRVPFPSFIGVGLYGRKYCICFV
jgi:hypothetical protein